MNKILRLAIAVVFDTLAVIASLFAALLLYNQVKFNDLFYYSLIVWPVILVSCFYILRIYNVLWRFSQYREILTIYLASFLAAVLLYISQIAFYGRSFNIQIFTTAFMFECVFISAQRLVLKKIYMSIDSKKSCCINGVNDVDLSGNIMIIGAGSAGVLIINEIMASPHTKGCKIKCVIDDDPAKKNSYIHGVRIIGGREMIVEAAKKHNISMIVFAIPSCPERPKIRNT